MKVLFFTCIVTYFLGELKFLDAFLLTSKLHCRERFFLWQGKKGDNDFIDAEIVDSGISPSKLTLPKFPGIFDDVTNKVSSAVSSGLSIFKGKESDDKVSQQKKEMNSMIDKAFQGTGLLGGVVGTIAKQVGSLVVDSLAESANDFEKVQGSIQRRIEINDRAVNTLGETTSLGLPLTTSMSTSNINGVITKNFYYILPVAGDRGSGQITAQGSIGEEGQVNFRSLILRTVNGEINLGGGPGPGLGASGKVIDVEIV